MDPLTFAIIVAVSWGAAGAIDRATDGWLSAEVGGGARGMGRYTRDAGMQRLRRVQKRARGWASRRRAGRAALWCMDEAGNLRRAWSSGRKKAQAQRRTRRGDQPLPVQRWVRTLGNVTGLSPDRPPEGQSDPGPDAGPVVDPEHPRVVVGEVVNPAPEGQPAPVVQGDPEGQDQEPPFVSVVGQPVGQPAAWPTQCSRCGKPAQNFITREPGRHLCGDCAIETAQPTTEESAPARPTAVIIVGKSSSHCSRCASPVLPEWPECKTCQALFTGIMSVYGEYLPVVEKMRPDLPLVDQAPPPELLNEPEDPAQHGPQADADQFPRCPDCGMPEVLGEGRHHLANGECPVPPAERTQPTAPTTPASTEGTTPMPATDITNAPAAVEAWESTGKSAESTGSAMDQLHKQIATTADAMGDFEVGGETDTVKAGDVALAAYAAAQAALTSHRAKVHNEFDGSIDAAAGHQPAAHTPMQPA